MLGPMPSRRSRKRSLFRVGGVVSGAVVAPTQALLPVLRLSASSSFLSDVAAYILAWAMGLSSSAGILPAPSHHARLPEARGRGLDMREGPGLPVRSDGSLPASRCSASMSFAVRLLNLLRGTVRGGWASC